MYMFYFIDDTYFMALEDPSQGNHTEQKRQQNYTNANEAFR